MDDHSTEDGKRLWADSMPIVRGLLGMVLAAYNFKTPAEILTFDSDEYFKQVDLVKHLSPTRGNGLRAMVQKIKDTAAAA